MVPEGWERVLIKDACESIIDCVNKTAPTVDYETPFKMIRTTNVRNGRVNTKDVRYVTEDTYLQWVRRGRPKNGDIIFTREAPVGEVGILESAEGVFLGQRTMMYRAHPDFANNYYLFYFLIAQILSTWDKAITTTEQLLANSQQQKKALMQQLLTGKKRLLDENGVRFSGEWSSTTIQNLFARVTTKNQGQSENVVTISGQQGLINQKEFFNKSVASEILDNYTLLRRGQFAYNKSYSNGYPMGAIKRLNRYEMAVVTTLYICFEIQAKKKADSNFWEQYFESGLLNRGLSQIAHEGGRAHGLLNVKPADFFGLKIPLPSIEEQAAIGQVLAHADKNVFVLKARIEFLKKEKKALMQQLLTGKRRVKVDEEAA